jgi:hypothetical protein
MSEPNATPAPLTLEALEAFIRSPLPGKKAVPLGTGEDPAGLHDALIDAAAVLADFAPFSLRPVVELTADQHQAALDRLIGASEPIAGGSGGSGKDEILRWTLKSPDRREALRRLGSRPKMLAALAANPGAATSVQQVMCVRLLNSESIDPTALDRDEIAALITAVRWLDGILDGLPSPDELNRQLARADLSAPLRRLVQEGFFGRGVERSRLQAHFEHTPDFTPPLFVYGPGGTGKSTLVARSILDQEGLLFSGFGCFAYVDIDNPRIRPETPLTFLLEIVRQLKIAAGNADWERIETSLVDQLNRSEGGRQLESVNFTAGYLTEIRDLLHPTMHRVIIAIDTFEEVQFLGEDVFEPALDLFFEICWALAPVRLVISGRTLPRYYLEKLCDCLQLPIHPETSDQEIVESIPLEWRPMNLAELTPDAARELLTEAARVANTPPLTSDEMDDVIGIVGRNPMSLRLAARVLRNGGLERLRQDAAGLLRELKAEKMQAMLYGRILHHIHLDDVAKVAYPGLVVRRITPAIIRDVLAGPCNLRLTAERDEFAIWNDLAHEVALVQRDDEPMTLRHRVDVRRVMLQDLLDHVEPDVVAAIDRAAIAFYAPLPGGPARAEEIYHRLRSGQSFDVLEQRWSADAIPYLRDALEDFAAARPRLWLANKLGVTLEGNLRQLAELEDWETQTARAVDRFLTSNFAERALDLLRERSARSARSQLYALEAETLRFLKMPDEALAVARAGVDALSRAGALDAAANLLLKMVVIEESRLHLDAANRLFQELQPIVARSNDPLLRLRAIVTRLRVDRKAVPGNRDERNDLRNDAVRLLTPEVLGTLRAHPVLLREIAAELSSVDATLAGRAIQTLGLEIETDEQLKAFAEAVAQLETQGGRRLSPELAGVATAWKQQSLNTDGLRAYVEQNVSARAVEQVASTLLVSEGPALKGIREYFRSGVDRLIS